jgi:hypothetical protein
LETTDHECLEYFPKYNSDSPKWNNYKHNDKPNRKTNRDIVNGIKSEIDISAIKSAKLPSSINPPTLTQSKGQTMDEIISELRQSSPNTPSLTTISNDTLPTITSGNDVSTQSSQITNSGSMTLDNYDPNHVAFSWCGKNFADGNFPHDDKVYYNINPNSDWQQSGNGIYDFMLNQADSENLPTFIISTTLGEIIADMIVEALIPVIGWIADIAEIATIIIGEVIGLVIWSVAKEAVVDENGNLWFWMGTGFFDFLVSYIGEHSIYDFLDPFNWPGFISDMLSGFWSNAYLRAGSITFANNLGINDPIAPQYYGNWVTSSYHWRQNSAATWNEAGLLGRSPDYPNNNYCAIIYAGTYQDMANIVTQLNAPGAGEVFVNAYSDSGYYSHMRVYVSPNNQNWYLLPSGDQYISSNTPAYYDCGSVNQVYDGPISYVMVIGWDSGCSTSLEVDCVQLINNPTLTVYSWAERWNYDTDNWDYTDVNPAVSVGNPGGGWATAPCTIKVSDGYHTVAVDDYITFEPWGEASLYYICCPDNAQYYSNGDNIHINYGMTLYVVYYCNIYP